MDVAAGAQPVPGNHQLRLNITRRVMPQTIDQEAILANLEANADEIQRQVDAERARLRGAAGLVQLQQQFKRPVERPFTAAERGKVTMLIGGMTWKHDSMFR